VRVLNVAEKSSVGKEIVRHLSGNNAIVDSRVCGQLVQEFSLHIGQPCQMIVTAVRGHLLEYDFKSDYKSWDAVNPVSLFDAEMECKVSVDSRPIASCLNQLARSSDKLILWLDCDREGEAICFEVLHHCVKANPRLIVKRAKFSALTYTEVWYAFRNLCEPNRDMSNAVVARIELDLRSGAALTRFLTMRYRSKLNSLDGRSILSYGPCQFPTLGIIYERWNSIHFFNPETFWSISLKVCSSLPRTDIYICQWERGRVFDPLVVHGLFDHISNRVLECDGVIGVQSVSLNSRSRWRPIPLNTIEMTKLVSSKLRIPSHKCMQIAEGLYTRGILSYPRTETDVYHESIDTRSLLSLHCSHRDWGGYCTDLLATGKYIPPRRGIRNDNAHPPIHPVKCVDQTLLDGDEGKIYELITRHFIASCSPDATGSNTIVKFKVGEEIFILEGLAVLQANWLEVFPYEKWSSSSFTLPPHWRAGSLVLVNDLSILDSKTAPPALLTEAELITKMDAHGIGTDATMHEHIRTVQERKYVDKTNDGRFFPTPLGVALAKGFGAYEDGASLLKPELRASMENGISAIARGELNPREFLATSIRKLKHIYGTLSDCPRGLDDSFSAIENVVLIGVNRNSAKRNVANRVRGVRGGRGGYIRRTRR